MSKIKYRQFINGTFHYWGVGVDDRIFVSPSSCGTQNVQNTPNDQFTVLHDKNGGEIYENDIIRWFGDKWLVKWVVDGWFAESELGYGSCEAGQEWEGYCVVIGNIHENPELLDD